jgi:hypothetical protein
MKRRYWMLDAGCWMLGIDPASSIQHPASSIQHLFSEEAGNEPKVLS